MNFTEGEILIIDKPYGWTSFDAVKRVRGAIQRRLDVKKFKVGHAGTLDPLATGVLIVCTGAATKRIETLQAGDKEYVATIRLGATTPSYDLEKDIDAYFPVSHITLPMVEEALGAFRGRIMQVPPVFSAVKVDGKRAYKYARKGAEVELKAKPLEISELELLSFREVSEPVSEQGADGCDDRRFVDISIRVVCSKGTYIRALARDIGEALGSGAHLTALRRTRVGECRVEDALSVDQTVELIKIVSIQDKEKSL